ncbi:cyclic amp-dependent transcription factor atf-4 [Plakobranchus ocellatus]|uniref:Cyclic amp-dependent transcription factor atf-4 n=1 Tax=Plakobranchus ocellatus TaxID=259542 RepID=A0AAV3Y6H6_9GAST|nr:cyclic amp-dependent transcription factor atf-4 [Plakobranchus ocellatus]
MDLFEYSMLDGNWGLDLPFHQENGLFGDLKSEGHVGGTDFISFQPQDAAKPSFPNDAIDDEDGLGLEWMESSDLGVYFEKLGTVDAKLPLDSTLQEFTSLIATEQPVIEAQGHLQSKNKVLSSETLLPSHIWCNEDLVVLPESPEQVTPVIQLTSEFDGESSIISELDTDRIDTDLSSSLWNTQTINGELDFNSVSQASELISLSADDVDSIISSSEPASPASSPDKSSSIIKASPELYKVISTSTLGDLKRSLPYPKSKLSRKVLKSPPQRRVLAQPVPEHVIVEQVNKKDRKKMQNKNAAIRYRQKKREEALGIKSEEQQLEDYNIELKTKVEDLEREIKYMKNLMEDISKAKGLLFS